MDSPYRFPRDADVIAEEAAKTLKLPFEDRMNRLLSLIATMRTFEMDPVTRLASQRHKERMEAEWQMAHSQIFQRHGK